MGEITVYGNPWCGDCRRAKKFLQDRGVAFHEVNVDGNPEAMELVSTRKIRVGPLITAIAPLSDGPAWFQRLYEREPNLMKIVLDPRDNEVLQ